MKLLSFFSGIGAFEKALERLGIKYELVGFSEICKYAVKSYCAIHNVPESMNLGDITKIDEQELPKNIDLVTYGFPCQDISIAGKQKGLFNEDGTQTRSGLFFEALRIIEATQPMVAIAENVKNLVGKKFKEQFQIVLDSLEQAGYNNYWKVLNAKDYGIPQNRERVFIVSIRKDIDTGFFQFPQGFPLELRLKDMLEDEVDEKFYVSDIALKGFAEHARKQREKGNSFHAVVKETDDIASTIKARYYKDGSDCLIRVKEATKQGYAEAYEGDSVNLEQPNSKTRRGMVGHGVAQTLTTSPQQGWLSVNSEAARILNVQRTPLKFLERNQKNIEGDYAFCVDTAQTGGVKEEYLDGSLRIRKLTPKECFRLMDFDDSDFMKAEAANSNTQLYKQAGNSIVVSCAEKIIEKLLECGVLRKEKNEMELRIEQITFPEVIDFNFEELKQEITNRVTMYANMVYTEDQVKQAKTDRANLNKFVKALSDERIKVKKQCMKPYEEFEAKVNELSKIVQEPISMIDKQVKEYEEQKKQEKLNEITYFFNSTNHPEWLHISQIMNEKWLNASVSMKSIQEEITSRCEQIENDAATLSNLPEFGFEATEVYKTTLDINKALNEGHRLSEIQKRKAEHEAEQARLKAEAEAKKQAAESARVVQPEPVNLSQDMSGEFVGVPVEERLDRMWISFKALLTTEDAVALKAFFESRNIQIEKI